MTNMRDFALNLIGRNPQIANNPNAKELLNVIQNGNQAKGMQIAQNLCNTYGVTPEQAVNQAKNFFNIP